MSLRSFEYFYLFNFLNAYENTEIVCARTRDVPINNVFKIV